MNLTPYALYQSDIEQGRIVSDPQQLEVLRLLQPIYQHFFDKHQQSKTLWGKIKSKLLPVSKASCKGLYIWGGVGIGKTYLMDLFFESLPTQRKYRTHFHQFMYRVHQDLAKLQGKSNPLTIIARTFSLHADVLCFDEFFVNDIADAMLLGNLLQVLLERGVCLLTTSNIPPELLYRDGLQRARFLPAIELIKQYTKIHHLSSKQDYRLRTLKRLGVYFTPLDETAQRSMQQCFATFSMHCTSKNHTLHISGRDISTLGVTETVVWFDFSVICASPRSQTDYLEIAQTFSTVLISAVPRFTEHDCNAITYFIHLIDIFYDNRVKLIVSAAVSIEQLYHQGKKKFEFQRARSRLLEMQSDEYWHRKHGSGV